MDYECGCNTLDTMCPDKDEVMAQNLSFLVRKTSHKSPNTVSG